MTPHSVCEGLAFVAQLPRDVLAFDVHTFDVAMGLMLRLVESHQAARGRQELVWLSRQTAAQHGLSRQGSSDSLANGHRWSRASWRRLECSR